MPLSSYLYKNSGPELAEIDPNIAYRVRSSDDGAHKQAHPWSSESTFKLIHGPYNPVQSEYATEQVLSLPRGQPVRNSESNFEEVKHVAPPTWAETPGQPELMNWERQGHIEPLPFVYNKHDLVFDESVPNRHAMSLNRLPLPQSRGHGTYQRALTGYGFGFGREVPVLGSSHFVNQPHRAMTRRGPMFATWERFPIWFPTHHARLLHRNINIKRPVQRNPFLKHVIKPIPVRISPWTWRNWHRTPLPCQMVSLWGVKLTEKHFVMENGMIFSLVPPPLNVHLICVQSPAMLFPQV